MFLAVTGEKAKRRRGERRVPRGGGGETESWLLRPGKMGGPSIQTMVKGKRKKKRRKISI